CRPLRRRRSRCALCIGRRAGARRDAVSRRPFRHGISRQLRRARPSLRAAQPRGAASGGHVARGKVCAVFSSQTLKDSAGTRNREWEQVMNKPVAGIIAGAVLGILDGGTSWFTPEVRPQIVGILLGSCFKGVL